MVALSESAFQLTQMRKIMAHHALASQESYNPNHLLDILLGKMQLKNDAALSRMLEVAPPVISKIRHHRLPVGASLLIRMHEVTGMSIRDLRDLMGDRRTKYRLSDAQGRPKPEEKAAQAAAQGQQSQGQQGSQAQSQESSGKGEGGSSGSYSH